MKPTLRGLGLLLLALPLFTTTPARAAADILWSGFGTVGAVASDDDEVYFTRVGVDRPGAADIDLGPDSVLGVQGNARLGEQTGAVFQLVSRENAYGDVAPRVTLAFVSHAITPTLTARIGRMRVPFFMLSDSLDINYANPWVRPPVEVYGLNPFTDLDGIDLLLRTRVGSVDVEIHPYAGTSYIPIYRDGRARLDRLAGINLALSHDALSLHVGHAEARIALHWGDPDFDRLDGALRASGLGHVADALSGDDGYAAFSSVGFQWDDSRWLVIGEYARRENRRYASSAHGWHFTAGRRFGNLLPYVGIARQTQDRPTSGQVALPPGTPFGAFIDAFDQSRNLAQRSATLGVRWDYTPNTAFKAELSHVKVAADGWGSFFPRGDAATTRMGDRRLNLLSLSVDVAF